MIDAFLSETCRASMQDSQAVAGALVYSKYNFVSGRIMRPDRSSIRGRYRHVEGLRVYGLETPGRVRG